MLLGVSMNNQDGLTGGIVHMFNHAVIKGGLFLVVGCFALRLHSVRLEDLRGAAKTMPLTAFAWVLGGLGLIGVPLTAGFISKWLLLTAALDKRFLPGCRADVDQLAVGGGLRLARGGDSIFL